MKYRSVSVVTVAVLLVSGTFFSFKKVHVQMIMDNMTDCWENPNFPLNIKTKCRIFLSKIHIKGFKS